MAVNLQKYARKSALDGLVAHSSVLTRQIAADLPSFGYRQFDRCLTLQVLENRLGYRRTCALSAIKLAHTSFDPVYRVSS